MFLKLEVRHVVVCRNATVIVAGAAVDTTIVTTISTTVGTTVVALAAVAANAVVVVGMNGVIEGMGVGQNRSQSSWSKVWTHYKPSYRGSNNIKISLLSNQFCMWQIKIY